MHDRFDSQDTLAFGIDRDHQQAEMNLEDGQVIRRTLDRDLGQQNLGAFVLADSFATIDDRYVMGFAPCSDPSRESARHQHQVSIVKLVVGPAQLSPPSTETAGSLSEPKVGIQNDTVDAVQLTRRIARDFPVE